MTSRRNILIGVVAAAALAAPIMASAQPAPHDDKWRAEQNRDRHVIAHDRAVVARDNRAVGRADARAAWDRSRANWWRGHAEFNGFTGHRPGYWFVPGFGYRSVPANWWGYHWGVGVVVPRVFLGDRTYFVTDPWDYGLPPAYPPFQWIFLGGNIARVNMNNGRIVQYVPNVW